MALQIGNKTYRNIPEQIQKNKEDIAAHYEVDRVLADWGIKVLGVYESPNYLPTEGNEYGDAYGVGYGAPYTYYIWTRANSNVGQETDYWLNVGVLSLVGPQGPQGIQGIQGVKGTRGSLWYSMTTVPSSVTGFNVNDQVLETSTGNVYECRTDQWVLLGNIKGPQGVQGPQGIQGIQGIEGPYGPQGPKGDTGSQYIIAGNLESIDLLPTPTEENRHQAYGVKNANNEYDLYLIIGTNNLMWFNYGPITAAQGAQGPTGAQGPMGQGQEIIDIASWFIEGDDGIVPETYRDSNRLSNALLFDSNSLGYYRKTDYFATLDDGQLCYVGLSNDGDAGASYFMVGFIYIYADWTIVRSNALDINPSIYTYTAQIIDDQGKLELVTYNSNNQTIDINESPNQFLQRNLNSPRMTLTSNNNYQGVENLTKHDKYFCCVSFTDPSFNLDSSMYAVMFPQSSSINFSDFLSQVKVYQGDFIVLISISLDIENQTASLQYQKINDPNNEYSLSIAVYTIEVY